MVASATEEEDDEGLDCAAAAVPSSPASNSIANDAKSSLESVNTELVLCWFDKKAEAALKSYSRSDTVNSEEPRERVEERPLSKKRSSVPTEQNPDSHDPRLLMGYEAASGEEEDVGKRNAEGRDSEVDVVGDSGDEDIMSTAESSCVIHVPPE